MTQKLTWGFASILFMAAAASASAGTELIVVCYPGGNVNAESANAAMTSMLRVVERTGQWPSNTFTSQFTSKYDECKTQMDTKKPRFAISSLGIFLEMRTQHHLIPLVQPRINGRTTERYHVVVQKEKYKNLEEIKGKTLGGTVLDDPSFIGKIVFSSKINPVTYFQLKPSTQAIRTLRALANGQLDAVILNEQQFEGLDALQLQAPLEAVFSSDEFPLMGVVANNAKTTGEERTRFTEAMETMCSDAEGIKLCQLFGVEAFVAADMTRVEPVIKLWKMGN